MLLQYMPIGKNGLPIDQQPAVLVDGALGPKIVRHAGKHVVGGMQLMAFRPQQPKRKIVPALRQPAHGHWQVEQARLLERRIDHEVGWRVGTSGGGSEAGNEAGEDYGIHGASISMKVSILPLREELG